MRLQIVDDRGEVVQVPAYGPLEVECVETIVKAITAYPVGYFRSQARVEFAIRKGLRDAFQLLKDQTRYLPRHVT